MHLLCCDIDQFFCQAAYLTWPDRLAGVELLVVGGHPRKRGVVASCSYAARRRGVRSAMPMATAFRICPELVAAPVPWPMVKRKSREVFAVLRRHAAVLERASIDEGYLLLTPGPEPLEVRAREIQRSVREETGITVSLGGSHGLRFIAKMATRHAKPGGVYVVPAGGELQFLDRHELGDIPGIGPAFLRDLERRGVSSIASARQLGPNTLSMWLGEGRARFLWERVRAIDTTPVAEDSGPRKSISSETTFENDLADREALEETLRELVADVGGTLRRDRLRARTIGVKVRGADFQDRQRSRTLPQAVETDAVIFGIARVLLQEARQRRPGALRLLGMTLSNLEGPGSVEQLAFPQIIPPLETEDDRRRQVERLSGAGDGAGAQSTQAELLALEDQSGEEPDGVLDGS
ncbi:MAG: DNA polymerase IV [Gemmatimonadetes bacterium]|nr:DNA polymerase IV [Gemmatimonadota bacterium]